MLYNKPTKGEAGFRIQAALIKIVFTAKARGCNFLALCIYKFYGQNYEKLCRCISIGLLDFNLTKREKYHSVYRLREEDGTEFTDLLEIHIVEMSKTLRGTEAVEDWIRLFYAESEEDLQMIKAKNAGIREAIGALKEMSLKKNLRYLYEKHSGYFAQNIG